MGSENTTLWDLFPEIIDYPESDTLAEIGVPQGGGYQYVSSTYLSGLINYTRPFYVIVVERYHEMTEKAREYYRLIASRHHTNYNPQGEIEGNDHNEMDDVMILSESQNSYWFFWSDRDCSDCVIARCAKADTSKEEMIKLVQRHVENSQNAERTGKYIEVPLPRGWIKF